MDMNEKLMDEFLFSLAWSSWSAFHSENAKRILAATVPEIDAEKSLSAFCEIILSKPQPGSPK